MAKLGLKRLPIRGSEIENGASYRIGSWNVDYDSCNNCSVVVVVNARHNFYS